MSQHPIRQDFLIPYRLKAVRIGIIATFFTLLGLGAFVLLPRHGVFNTAAYMAALSVAALGVAVVAVLPWKTLFDSGWGLRLMYLWSAFDIALITLLIAIIGPHHSEVFMLYFLTTVFFATACYPRVAQVGLLTLTFASYLGLIYLERWDLEPALTFLRVGLLAFTAYLASFLSRSLFREIDAHSQAHTESLHRADLLATVASAARNITSLDADKVLGKVVDSVIDLGFEVGNINVLDADGHFYRVVHPRGIPESYVGKIQPASQGMVGMVLDKRDTVVVDDYSARPDAVPALKNQGFKSVMASPIWAIDEICAVLVGGTRRQRSFDSQEIEAFELLAAQAGRALEIARRFEEQKVTLTRLAELDRLKSDFLSNMSHELRTPLTVIEGMAVTLETRWDSIQEPLKRSMVSRLLDKSRALSELILKLLDFSQVAAGQLSVRPRPVSTRALVEAVRVHTTEALANHVLTTTAEDLVVEADPDLLERILENLLNNAAQHTRAGTHVSLSVRRNLEAVEFIVEDNGDGIAEEELEHIGERFFRGGDSNSRGTPGVGLGLAWIREILVLHSTRLVIDNRVGEGCKFSFTLPVSSKFNQVSLPSI